MKTPKQIKMMKITNAFTGILLITGGVSLTLEHATAIFGFLAVLTAIAINVIAYFRGKNVAKIENNKNEAEKEVALLEAKLLEKQISLLDKE